MEFKRNLYRKAVIGNPLKEINWFLGKCIPNYNKDNTIHFINAFIAQLNPHHTLCFRHKCRYIYLNWEDFRNWFFDQDRIKLEIETRL